MGVCAPANVTDGHFIFGSFCSSKPEDKHQKHPKTMFDGFSLFASGARPRQIMCDLGTRRLLCAAHPCCTAKQCFVVPYVSSSDSFSAVPISGQVIFNVFRRSVLANPRKTKIISEYISKKDQLENPRSSSN